MTQSEKELFWKIVGVLIAIGAVIRFAQNIFPFFEFMTAFSLVIVIICVIRDLASDGTIEFDFYSGSWTPPALVLFGIFFAGFAISGLIGFGLGGTFVGQVALQTYDTASAVEQQVQIAINQFVDDTCKGLTPENCSSLRLFAKTAQTLQAVEDYASTLETVSNVAKKISS